MSKVAKGLRFVIEILVITAVLFIFLIAIGQLERAIGLTSEVTAQYSIFMLAGNLLLVYTALHATLLRVFPFKIFKYKKLKRSTMLILVFIAIILLGYVYLMTNVIF